ncbi:MAG: cytochrome c [Flavobacteriaceae bacterium]|nr:cytochrome c [Flavobacteriaceae bacterium]
MKKFIVLLGVLAFTFAGCGDKKKAEDPQATEPAQEEVKQATEQTTEPAAETTTTADDKDAQIAMGEKLFTSKTCATCHALDTKIIGPSIKDIIKIYDEKGGNIVKFLKGNEAAMVDTDPAQVAIMKANIDGFVKDMTPEELQAVAAYMRSVSK